MIKIRDWIGNRRPDRLKSDGCSAYYTCPYCSGRAKLEVGKGKWYCHKCKAGGRTKATGPGGAGGVAVRDSLDEFCPCDRNSGHWFYLKNRRGMTDQLIVQLQPHYGPTPLRVYFPLYDLGGTQPVRFVGRDITGKAEVPYLDPPVNWFKKRKHECMWGLHRINGSRDHLILCEGVFDAVWYPEAVALLSSHISRAQVELVHMIDPHEVTVMLDGDAQKEAMEVCLRLKRTRVYLARLPSNRDPDELRGSRLYLHRRERVH